MRCTLLHSPTFQRNLALHTAGVDPISFLWLPMLRQSLSPSLAPSNSSEGCERVPIINELHSFPPLLNATHMPAAIAYGSTTAVKGPFKKLPIVERSETFPGLYPVSGNDMYWQGNESLIVNTVRFSGVVVYRVDLATTQDNLQLLLPAESNTDLTGTWTVLDVSSTSILLSHSCSTSLPKVYRVDGANNQFVLLKDYADSLPQTLSPPSTYVTEKLTVRSPRWTESLYHYRPSTTPRPLVLFVHGGPHAVDNNAFLHFLWFYLESGLNVLSVNYAGSLGFGQWSIDSLLGHIGQHDVEDCMLALDEAIAIYYTGSDKPKVIVSGGSHGGYLGAHFTGRYPERFAAAFLRNPVINLASMYWETDISDWCLAEVGLSAPDVEAFYKASPIQYAGNVRAATLIGVGTEDLRVPPPQGRSWYYAIRRSHTEKEGETPLVRLLEYPANSHPLDGTHASTDFHLNSIKLLQELSIVQ